MNDQTTLVRVTREHIARGVVCNSGKCPVALAVIDALGDLYIEGSWIDVGDEVIQLGRPPVTGPPSTAAEERGERRTADTPPIAADFIDAFDERDGAGPIEFTLTWRISPEEDWT